MTNNKRILVTILAGIFILAGILAPNITQAALLSGAPMEQGPGMMAQQMADTFGMDKDDVAKYLHQGVSPRDLMHAAMLAKAGDRPLTDVLQMKTLANTWQDVKQSLGVTEKQLNAFHQDMMATQLEKKLAIPKNSTIDLLKQGYHSRDIVMANVLSQNTKTPVIDVLAMKKINNEWNDVAKKLGVDDETFKQDMNKIRETNTEWYFQGMYGPMGGSGGMSGGPSL